MKRIRVCQLFGLYGYGGIYRVAEELALRLGRFFDVVLLCRKVLREPEEKIEIIELDVRNTADLWKKLQELEELFDVIHTHDVYSLPGLVSKRRRKAKIVYTDHGIVPLKYQDQIVRNFPGFALAHFCRMFARQADMSVGVSSYITDELKRIGCWRALTIPNGVDIEKFKPIKEPERIRKFKMGDPMLLKVGLVERHKNIDYHIAAMPLILRRFPKANLVFIGTGKDLERYKRLVKASKLDGYVHFLGWVPDSLLPLYYNAADIVIQVDFWHGFGLPILEAMACGKPVITRDAYAMREHILLSKAGVLVEGKDPKELVMALDQVFSNYGSYSLRARRYAESLSWDNVVVKYVKVYEWVLEETLSP